MEPIHHDVAPNPYRGDLHDLRRLEIEVAGLDVEGDEVVEIGLQVAGMNQLKRLEHPERQSTVGPIAGSKYHIAGGRARRPGVSRWALVIPAPRSMATSGISTPPPGSTQTRAPEATHCARRFARAAAPGIERRLAQIVVVLLQRITSGPDGPREQLIHQAGQRMVGPAHPPQVLQVVDQSPHPPAVGVSLGALTGKGPKVGQEVLLLG